MIWPVRGSAGKNKIIPSFREFYELSKYIVFATWKIFFGEKGKFLVFIRAFIFYGQLALLNCSEIVLKNTCTIVFEW